MTSYLKKTILLFTLTGVVFFGGGVGVVRGENNNLPIPNQQPSTPTKNDTGNNEQERIERMARANQDTSALNAIKCGGFWDKLSLGCIMPVITYDLYVVISGVLTLSGDLFDFMLTMSIEKDFINQPFVISLWKVLRDFSNMLFIFILLYAGIRTMLLGDDWKKPVMMVVVIALLINFSLFFTQIIIDAGNTLAVGVYSSMGVTKETSVSAAFVNNFAPQQFFSLSAEKIDLAPTIFIIAGIVGGFFAWVLFKASFLFLGRIISFWALMILSPFAFILLAFPALGAKVKFSFGAWLDILINQAFVAPAFLFFLYIIMKVVQSKPLADFGIPSGSGALMDVLFKPALFAIMIVYALKKALAVADSMSGEFGKIGADIGNKVLGIAAMGTGVGLTAGVGAVAGSALRSETLKRWTESDNWLAKRVGGRAEQIFKGAHEKPMDFRNISIGGKKLGEHLGIESFGLKKGYKQTREDETKRIAGIGEAASKERIASQTTQKETVKSAQDARTDAETKAKVAKESKQTTIGKQAEANKDIKRAAAATPQGIATAAAKANEQEMRRQAKKESVNTPVPARAARGVPGTPGYTPATPAQKSLVEQLNEKKDRNEILTLEDRGGNINNPPGTLNSLAEQADTAFEVAKATLSITPLSSPDYAAAVASFTLAKTNKTAAEKKLKEFKEGADSIEKLEKKIEEYSAL